MTCGLASTARGESRIIQKLRVPGKTCIQRFWISCEPMRSSIPSSLDSVAQSQGERYAVTTFLTGKQRRRELGCFVKLFTDRVPVANFPTRF